MSDLLDADFGGELATSRFVLILFFVIFLEAVYILRGGGLIFLQVY